MTEPRMREKNGIRQFQNIEVFDHEDRWEASFWPVERTILCWIGLHHYKYLPSFGGDNKLVFQCQKCGNIKQKDSPE